MIILAITGGLSKILHAFTLEFIPAQICKTNTQFHVLGAEHKENNNGLATIRRFGGSCSDTDAWRWVHQHISHTTIHRIPSENTRESSLRKRIYRYFT